MKNIAKLAAVAAAALATTPAHAQAVGVAPGTEPVATARIIKPLTLSATGSMNFGTIVIPAGGVTANRLIRLGTNGVIAAADCGGGNPEVTCSGTTSVPTYTVTGTQGQWVTINKNTSTLTGSVSGSLQLTPTGDAQVQLANSGSPGTPFAIGGDITIAPTTADGVYTGTVNVTVNY